MKKLMLAVSAVAMAASLQAASVVWGGAVSEPDGVTSVGAGRQAALLFSATAFTGSLSSIDSWVVGATGDNGGSVVQVYTITAFDADTSYAFSSTYEKAGESVDGYYAVLVQDSTGNKATYYDIGQVSGTTATSSPVDKTVNVDWSGTTYLTSGDYTVAIGAVPEPTSGLLLLLGMAGLALRRKRA